MKSDDILVVYLTFADTVEAERIGHALVTDQLVACIAIIPGVTSIYSWQGKVQQDREIMAIAKTKVALFDALRDRVLALHSYDTPCIAAWPLSHSTDGYKDWLGKALSMPEG